MVASHPSAIERSTVSNELSERQQVQIQTWLAGMGAARREPLGELELRLYSKGLAEFPPACTMAVIGRLTLGERDEYEAKIPALGDLRAMVRAEVRRLHPWVPCGECSNGMRVVERDGRQFAGRCECWLAWKRRGEVR